MRLHGLSTFTIMGGISRLRDIENQVTHMALMILHLQLQQMWNELILDLSCPHAVQVMHLIEMSQQGIRAVMAATQNTSGTQKR